MKCSETDLDIVIALSLAVNSDDKWRDLKNWARDIVERQTISSTRTSVSLVTLSYRLNIQFELNTYTNKNDVLDAIDRIGCVFIIESLLLSLTCK